MILRYGSQELTKAYEMNEREKNVNIMSET